MARSDIAIARDQTLQNRRIGRSKPPSHSGDTASPIYMKSAVEQRSGSFRDDGRPLVRRSMQFHSSRDSVPSLHASTHSPSFDKKRGPDSQLMDSFTGNTSSDGLDHRSKVKGPSKTKAHLKPLLRKMSRDDTSGIDLSRSSFDREGLGIYTGSEREGRSNDPFANYTFRRPMPQHHRSTSGTSQISGTSSSTTSKPGSQYIHPMRQAPRSYTPPGQSYQTSIIESDDSGNGEFTEGDSSAQGSDPFQGGSMRGPSGQRPRLSLQIHDSPFNRLSGISQTNVTGRSSFGYSRENGNTLDTASPMSRASLDFAFRSKTRPSMDPISRAATVQAARQAFEEKEAAKMQKLEKQQIKAEERQTRRKEKPAIWRTSLRDGDTPATVSEKDSNEKSSKPDITGPRAQPSDPKSDSWKSQSKNTWVLFLTWLRTRIFKLRRKLRNIG